MRHDVMSHVYAYGQQCPHARPIIHLGATSCYVGDNTDLILMHEVDSDHPQKLVTLIGVLAKFADNIRTFPLWPLPISSRLSLLLWVSAPHCGCRSCCLIWRKSSMSWAQ